MCRKFEEIGSGNITTIVSKWKKYSTTNASRIENYDFFWKKLKKNFEISLILFSSQVARKLHKEVGARFPEAARSSVGGYICLRFVCPAMVNEKNLKKTLNLIF